SWILKAIVTIILIIFLIGVFFYTKKCESLSCFNSYLEKCNKARYIGEENEAAWYYSIKGIMDGKCIVNVKLLTVKKGNINLAGLEGEEMNCYLDYGKVINPKDDIKECHGILKEKLQERVIDKLNSYIVQNIGKISEELKKIY
ncbi:MAG: hypothetical protein QXF25_01600, partial [Candidatus Pacearchaeota archaeon]